MYALNCVQRFLAATCLAMLPSLAIGQTVVLPYVQPGDARSNSDSDSKVLHWFTEQKPADYTVEYRVLDGKWLTAKATRITLDFAELKVPEKKPKEGKPDDPPAKTDKDKGDKDKAKKDKAGKEKEEDDPDTKKEPKVPLPPEKEQHYYKYTAVLGDLPLSTQITYRVKQADHIIRESAFRTRVRPDQSIRCVLVGDLAQGRPYQRPVAYSIAQQKPDFLVALGDIVYPTGRINQYMHFYWETYNNTAKADPKIGAPLMASVPFYPVLGNHDIKAQLSKVPDALGAYYFFSPPKNGPGEGACATPLDGDEATKAKFRAATIDSYPFIDVYSFDNGPIHVVVLNVNPKMDLADPQLRKWLTDDLRAAKDRWKIVCYHMPAFHSSKNHYAEQQARALSPLFEAEGVNLTFAGHVHNYQRTMPIKFLPDAKQPLPDAKQPNKKRVDGTFTLDTAFDGVKNTKPNGVIHIVSGGGGASLYGPGLDKTKDILKKQFGSNYADYTAKMVADQHSFSVLDCSPNRLELRAINVKGEELDHIVIDK
jgi:acid phosphatase type 7